MSSPSRNIKHYPTAALPAKQFQAIGELIAWWSLFEWQIEQYIRTLVDVTQEDGRIILTQMHIRPKVEIWNLLRTRKMGKPSDDLVIRINKAYHDRNKVGTPIYRPFTVA